MLPVGKKLMDQNSAALLSFGYTASAVNNIQIDNAATGQSPAIRAVGSDTNVGLQIIPKGTGSLTVPSGKVGLGVTSPASPLDVQAIMDNSAPAGLIVRRNSSQFIHLHEFGGGNHALEAVDPAANQKPFYISKMTTGGAPAAGQSDIVFSFVQDNGTGYINRSAFSALTLQAGTGNVGINTPTPGAKLTVVGSGSPVSSTATPNGILILSGATNTNTVLTAGVDNPGGNPYGWLQTRHANSGPAFYPLSLNPLGGNVGIGIIAPSERLDVTGNIKTSGQLILPGSGTDIFSVSNTSSGIHTEIKLSVGDNALDAEADKLTIGATDWATGTWHPRLSVMSSGNVGIGIASPSEKLDVVGNAKVSGTLTVGGAPVLTTAGGSGANLTALNASNISTGSLTAARLPSEAVQLTSTQTLTNKTLPNAKLTGTTTLGGSTVAQQVFVDSSGNVGIGTNTPGNKLTVIGDAFVQGNFVASSISSDTIISAYEVAANWITFGGGMFIESIPNPADPELWVSGGNLLHLNGYEKINLISKEIRIGLDTSFAPVIKAEVTPGSAPQTYDNQDLVLQPSGSGRVKITSSTEIVGNVTIKNMGAVKSVIRISPAGDIGMGDFTAGTNPNPEL